MCRSESIPQSSAHHESALPDPQGKTSTATRSSTLGSSPSTSAQPSPVTSVRSDRPLHTSTSPSLEKRLRARDRGRVRTLKSRDRRVGRKRRLIIPRPLSHRFKKIWDCLKQHPDALPRSTSLRTRASHRTFAIRSEIYCVQTHLGPSRLIPNRPETSPWSGDKEQHPSSARWLLPLAAAAPVGKHEAPTFQGGRTPTRSRRVFFPGMPSPTRLPATSRRRSRRLGEKHRPRPSRQGARFIDPIPCLSTLLGIHETATFLSNRALRCRCRATSSVKPKRKGGGVIVEKHPPEIQQPDGCLRWERRLHSPRSGGRFLHSHVHSMSP